MQNVEEYPWDQRESTEISSVKELFFFFYTVRPWFRSWVALGISYEHGARNTPSTLLGMTSQHFG